MPGSAPGTWPRSWYTAVVGGAVKDTGADTGADTDTGSGWLGRSVQEGGGVWRAGREKGGRFRLEVWSGSETRIGSRRMTSVEWTSRPRP